MVKASKIPEIVRKYLSYNPDTGNIRWLVKRGRKAKGDLAGYVAKSGYISIGVDGVLYYAHRIAYYLHHNENPKFVDHVNNDRADNRIANLRSVSHSGNNINKVVQSNNKSGHPGVAFDKRTGKWMARITLRGSTKWLGRFETMKEAVKARQNAEFDLIGNFKHDNSMTI
tara:strand:+ start:4740 stop:5249 length:510 start_codon:yes stop_codon:yes gene_type:complete